MRSFERHLNFPDPTIGSGDTEGGPLPPPLIRTCNLPDPIRARVKTRSSNGGVLRNCQMGMQSYFRRLHRVEGVGAPVRYGRLRVNFFMLLHSKGQGQSGENKFKLNGKIKGCTPPTKKV